MTDGGRAGRALGRGSKVFSPPAVAGRPGRPAARTASKARPWPRRDEGQPPSSFHSYTPCQPPAEPNSDRVEIFCAATIRPWLRRSPTSDADKRTDNLCLVRTVCKNTARQKS